MKENNLIVEKGYKNNFNVRGTAFLVGNLFIGVRGFLEEETKIQNASINLPLLYDKDDSNPNFWTTSVNICNPLYTVLRVNDNILSPEKIKPFDNKFILDTRNNCFIRETTYKCADISTFINSQRFVSADIPNNIYSRYEFSVDKTCLVNIKAGIDLDLYELEGHHLKDNYDVKIESRNTIIYTFYTKSKNVSVTVRVSLFSNNLDINTASMVLDNNKHVISLNINALPNIKYTLDKKITIYYKDMDGFGLDVLDKEDIIDNNTFSLAITNHHKIWHPKFDFSNVTIDGDKKADISLRHAIFNLLSLEPSVRNNSSVPARGISGQTYKGAIFWDTEMFMFPFYLLNDIKSCYQIINYRIKGLDEAIKKAASYGYQGAFYAWESIENGIDACSDYNVVDVFTSRPVRTYFKDKQIHINGAIVYAIYSLYNFTKDEQVLRDSYELIKQCALFYVSYAKTNLMNKTVDILDVLGPDEYHERVNNNIYTNYIIKHTLFVYLRASKILGITSVALEVKATYIYNYIYIPTPNAHNVIPQFDGYFNLKDISLKELLSQKLDKNEYLGGHGLAGDTKIIKQADTITALYLFNNLFSKEVLEANFNYYEPKTEHGSTLSSSMYSLIASKIGKSDYAYEHFIKSASVDLEGKTKQYAGKVYIGGSHIASFGGAYMSAIYGFTSLDLSSETPKVSIALPSKIKSISYNIKYNNKKYNIYVNHTNSKIKEF
ncbi:MAG: hypothetical protein LBV51_00760 [Acholeplasmatales bacterium]|nr:hypothetical protein [Acholeplasmatales bacterium]